MSEVNNKPQLDEIKRHASEIAFCISLLVVDDSTAGKFSEQTIAKENAAEGLKLFQECDIGGLVKAFGEPD